MERLLATIDELQSSDSNNQLAARRAERELREEREKALRLERELEGWKGLRMERGNLVPARSGTLLAVSEIDAGSRRSSLRGGSDGSRKVSGHDRERKVSGTKGFL